MDTLDTPVQSISPIHRGDVQLKLDDDPHRMHDGDSAESEEEGDDQHFFRFFFFFTIGIIYQAGASSEWPVAMPRSAPLTLTGGPLLHATS